MKLAHIFEAKYKNRPIHDWIVQQINQYEFPKEDELIKSGKVKKFKKQLNSEEELKRTTADIKDKYGEPTLEDRFQSDKLWRYGWDFTYRGVLFVIYADFHNNTIEIYTQVL